MNNLYEKSQQHQNDLNVNGSLHNQSPQGDSITDVSHNPVLKCENWDIKPGPYLHLKQDLTPDLGFKSELPASTLNLLSGYDPQYQDDNTIVTTEYQEYKADVSMASSKEHNGL